MRGSAEETEVVFIHNSRPVCNHKGAAVCHEIPDFFLNSGPKQIQHRCKDNPVAGKTLLHIKEIHIHTQFPKTAIYFLHGIHVMQSHIPWSLRILHGPAAFAVMQNCSLCLRRASRNLRQIQKRLARLCHLTEHARILSAVVVNDRPVELLARTAALADLEILDTVGTMRHCLQRCRL